MCNVLIYQSGPISVYRVPGNDINSWLPAGILMWLKVQHELYEIFIMPQCKTPAGHKGGSRLWKAHFEAKPIVLQKKKKIEMVYNNPVLNVLWQFVLGGV